MLFYQAWRLFFRRIVLFFSCNVGKKVVTLQTISTPRDQAPWLSRLEQLTHCAWNPVKLVAPDGNDWYSYAGGVAGIAMNNKRDLDGNRIGMQGCFNGMKNLTGRSLSGPLSLCQLDAPRFGINGVYLKGGKEIAAISFAKNPSKADRFEKR